MTAIKQIFLTLLLLPGVCFAADFGCGRDTDRNGSVDAFCPGDDADNDGYTTAQGDCNDQDWDIWPGATWSGTKVGCSAGQWKTCRADGAGWSSEGCVTSSSTPFCPDTEARTTHSGKVATGCIYFDFASGSNTTGNGSWSTPYKDLTKVSDVTGDVDVAAGYAYVLKHGTYAGTSGTSDSDFGLRHGYFESRDGTSGSPIWIIGYPPDGSSWAVMNPGTSSPDKSTSIGLNGSDYYIIRGLKFTGSYGYPLLIKQSSHVETSGNWLTDAPGNGGADNHGCIAYYQPLSDAIVLRNHVQNCDNPAATTNPNNASIHFDQPLSARAEYNTALQTNGRTSYCVKYKHDHWAFTSGTAKGNYCYANQMGFAGGRNWTVENNLIVNDKMDFANLGGATFYENTVIRHNTVIAPADAYGALAMGLKRGHTTDDEAAANDYSGAPASPQDITITENIFVANYTGTNDSNYLFGIGRYGYGDNYDAYIGALNMSNNGYYAPNETSNVWGRFRFFDNCTGCSAGEGDSYSTLSDFATAHSGLETGSLWANPALNTQSLPTHVSMLQWGYRDNSPSVAHVMPRSFRGKGKIKR